MITQFRTQLRKSQAWVFLRNAQMEGIQKAARRYYLWSQILKTDPIATDPVGTSSHPEIHLLCYWRDYLPALWSLKSFYWHSGVRYPAVIHTQGKMPSRAIRRLTAHLPNALIVGQTKADQVVEAYLEKHRLTRLLAARRANGFMLKLTDFVLFGGSANLLTLDSDLLFFRQPVELLVGDAAPVSTHWFQQDPTSNYNITEHYALEQLGVNLQPRINTGIMLFARQHETLDYCDSALADANVARSTGWIEQTLYALWASRSNTVGFLPATYQLSLKPGLRDGAIARHYAGPTRPLLTSEGMPTLVRQGFLARRAFVAQPPFRADAAQ